jgi:hypothetical protein
MEWVADKSYICIGKSRSLWITWPIPRQQLEYECPPCPCYCRDDPSSHELMTNRPKKEKQELWWDPITTSSVFTSLHEWKRDGLRTSTITNPVQFFSPRAQPRVVFQSLSPTESGFSVPEPNRERVFSPQALFSIRCGKHQYRNSTLVVAKHYQFAL